MSARPIEHRGIFFAFSKLARYALQESTKHAAGSVDWKLYLIASVYTLYSTFYSPGIQEKQVMLDKISKLVEKREKAVGEIAPGTPKVEASNRRSRLEEVKLNKVEIEKELIDLVKEHKVPLFVGIPGDFTLEDDLASFLDTFPAKKHFKNLDIRNTLSIVNRIRTTLEHPFADFDWRHFSPENVEKFHDVACVIAWYFKEGVETEAYLPMEQNIEFGFQCDVGEARTLVKSTTKIFDGKSNTYEMLLFAKHVLESITSDTSPVLKLVKIMVYTNIAYDWGRGIYNSKNLTFREKFNFSDDQKAELIMFKNQIEWLNNARYAAFGHLGKLIDVTFDKSSKKFTADTYPDLEEDEIPQHISLLELVIEVAQKPGRSQSHLLDMEFQKIWLEISCCASEIPTEVLYQIFYIMYDHKNITKI
jgi:hypothetical protein